MDRKNRQGVLRIGPKARSEELATPAVSHYEVQSLRLAENAAKTVEAHVSQNCLRANIDLLKSHLDEKTRFCAVVKANAYGHDARLVTRSISDRVDMFAVTTFDEAEEIFPFAQGTPILIMTPLFSGITEHWLRVAQVKGYHCTICSMGALKRLQEHLNDSPATIHLHLKVDTGMGRCGATAQEAMELYQAISQDDRLQLDGVYTHFASGSQPDNPLTQKQLQEFNTFLDQSRLRANPWVCKHACNTGATLNLPQAHFDMVRCGLGIYGHATSALENELSFQPAMNVRAPLVQVKRIRRGQSCGYDATFVAQRDMLIGIVPVGYADGLSRSLSNRISLRLGTTAIPVIGLISMNATIVDLTGAMNPQEGNWVTVFDDKLASPCSISNLAKATKTINYEIITGINRQIPRILVD